MTDKDEALRSIFRDDPEMSELIEMFVSELPERIQTIQELFQKGDSAGLERIAHQLRGASGGYGFESVGDSAKELEAAIHSHADADLVRQRVDDLIRLCSRVAA